MASGDMSGHSFTQNECWRERGRLERGYQVLLRVVEIVKNFNVSKLQASQPRDWKVQVMFFNVC